MRVLITGKGTSGSFAIRGEQLGRAIGATVQPMARDLGAHDIVVIVKRPPQGMPEAVRRAGSLLVWDVVDAYPQPDGNDWDAPQCMAWLEQQFETIKPHAIVAATVRMAMDCAKFGVPVLALHHHARPHQRVNPIREKVMTVGYEGGNRYLGAWDGFMRNECARRGWAWNTQPASLADLDIVVAVRQQTGYAPRYWKSNVKLANAQGSGTPCVVNCEAGYRETMCGAEFWADTEAEMVSALDRLESAEVRREIRKTMLAAAPTLESVAEKYAAWLRLLSS